MTSFIRRLAHNFIILLTGSSCLCAFFVVLLNVAHPIASHAQQSALRSHSVSQRERVEVVTDTLKITFGTEGGSVVRTEFLKTPSNVRLPSNLVLLDDSRDRVYLAQTGLIGPANGSLPTHRTPMVFSGERSMKDGLSELVVKFESPVVNGVKLIKTYAFQRGSYVVSVQHTVVNVGTQQVTPSLYLQLVRDGNREAPSQQSKHATFTGPAVYSASKKYQRVEFHEIETNSVAMAKTSPYGYVAMVQHYFASAWLLGDGIDRDYFVRRVDSNLYSVGMITKLKDIVPGASMTVDARFFVGPRLESITTPLRLEAMQDDGWVLNLLQRFEP